MYGSDKTTKSGHIMRLACTRHRLKHYQKNDKSPVLKQGLDMARSFSRFSIRATAVERSSKVRFSRQTVFPARRTAIWASQAAEPSLRFLLMMVPMGLQHLAKVTTFVVNHYRDGRK